MTRPVHIVQTAAFLPLEPVENDAMEGILGMAGERPSRSRKITLRSNGIRTRHYVIDPADGRIRYSNAALAAEAVRVLARDSAFDLAQLQCLSAGTSIPDQILPGHGSMVHGELGRDGVAACEVVTTAGVCCAGVAALKYAWLAVASGEHDNAIASASETPSPVLRATRFAEETRARCDALEAFPGLAFEKDFLRWMLSDGSGALLLTSRPADARPSLRIDWIEMLSQANTMPTCMYAGAEKRADGSLQGWAQFDHDSLGRESVLAIKQDVRLLNDNILRCTIGDPLAQIIARRALKADDVDWFLPHISSEYFRQGAATTLESIGFGIPQDRWFTNLTTCGNTGAASPYIILNELFRSGRLCPGQRLLCFVPESGRFSTAFIHLTVV
jgi:3-oxoacyl-[acyl-carrier-protein] synthase-3